MNKIFILICFISLTHILNAQTFKNEYQAKVFFKDHKITDSIEGIWSLTSSMEVYNNSSFIEKINQNEHTKRIVIYIVADTIYCLNTDGTEFGSIFEKTAVKNQYIYSEVYPDKTVSATLYLSQNIMITGYFLPEAITKEFLGEEAQTKKLKHNLKFIKIYPY